MFSLLLSAIFVCGLPSLAREKGNIELVPFKSELAGRVLPYYAFLPSGYADSNSRYPVLYLLHGLAGAHTNWLTNTNLADYLSRYKLIVITPEGHDGWYTDSATVASDRYESYLIKELITDVDSRYRTLSDRRARGIAGLSMGGYGALKFGFKFPEKFVFAASISGAFDAAQRSDEKPGFAWDFLRPSVMSVFGPVGSQTRAANDLHRIAADLTPEKIQGLPYIYLSCGTEDGFLPTNRELDNTLLSKKVPHEFRELPGGHDWGFWDKQVREVLSIFARLTEQSSIE